VNFANFSQVTAATYRGLLGHMCWHMPSQCTKSSATLVRRLRNLHFALQKLVALNESSSLEHGSEHNLGKSNRLKLAKNQY